MHLSLIWAQASQLASLPLIYITFLGLHILFLEVHDKKDTTGEEKKDTVVSELTGVDPKRYQRC